MKAILYQKIKYPGVTYAIIHTGFMNTWIDLIISGLIWGIAVWYLPAKYKEEVDTVINRKEAYLNEKG
ncbi:hypothetical protein [Dehalobacterium formicoaceticum]|uniref:hypothetical protein n=1 Tax=Dehalobacterium formicoaceticum TaxID=51515 RepID=UPI0031F71446